DVGPAAGGKHQVAPRRTIARNARGETDMKWGGYNRKGEERMKKMIDKLFGAKTMYYLLTIAALGLLLAESIKWRPDGR
ncbi:hypothetical protein ACFLS0_07635, partial [Candidatus Bipolaricaulota bacterium]